MLDYGACFRTKTHNQSEHAYGYVSGLVRIESKRTMANIARLTGMDEQETQHFMSDSPWSGPELIRAIQQAVQEHPEFECGAMLVVDESAEEKTGGQSAAASRQHNGRLGKIELSQVGVFASLVTPRMNLWIDGELFFPESWFAAEHAATRQKVGFPAGREFKTKQGLAGDFIERIKADGVAFEAVAMDDLYGRNAQLRRRLADQHIEYYGDVPATTVVYLDQPQIVYPLTQRGKPSKHYQIVAYQRHEVRDLLHHPAMEWADLTLRPNERGHLRARFGRCRVWTVFEGECRPEWLLIRQDKKQVTYVLSNADLTTSLATLAWRKSHRYFIERSNQDAKGELGWDDFQAVKYLAWQHHLALTILASWFIALTRLDWMTRFERDPALLAQYQTDVLPLLSVSNVRELLRAAIPLPQLSAADAVALVVKHLTNRTRARKSRLRRNLEGSFET